MALFAIICGVIAGGVLFSSHDQTPVGFIVGGLMAFLLVRLIRLQNTISRLERLLAQEGARATAPEPAARPDRHSESFAPQPGELPPDREKIARSRQAPLPFKPAAEAGPAKPETAPPPDDGNPIDLRQIIISYFTGGNVVVRVGIVVLFFGVAFLLKYTAERNLVPIEFRLLSVCLAAMTLLLVGWRLRRNRQSYALILQGGGIGVLYLTIFAAMRLYDLLPPWLALPLLVGMSLFSATLAMAQDARALAVIGVSGGFLAPVLASTGAGSQVMLFSYYALLNAGILYTAWHKSWRELNLIGFVFTFVIGTLWGTKFYAPEMFASTEPFLILFFLFYIAISVLFAKNLPLAGKGFVDSSLVFGTPIICFALQTAMVKPYEYGLAWSALAMGLLYASLARLIFAKGNQAMRTMVEAFLGLALVFGTIAIPLALDGRWTAAAWALEGAAMVWIGLRQNRRPARFFGLALQPLAGLAILADLHMEPESLPLINGFFLGCLAVSLAGLLSGYFLFLQREKITGAATESLVAFTWGLLWWGGAGLHEIDFFVDHPHKLATGLAFLSASAPLFFLSGHRLGWPAPRQASRGLLGILLLAGIASVAEVRHPGQAGGFLAWPLAFFLQYFLLYRLSGREEETLSELDRGLHIGSLLLLVALLSWELRWWVDFWVDGSGTWPLIATALLPALVVLLLSRFPRAIPWPVACFPVTYLARGLAPVALYLWLWTLAVPLFSKGDPWPLTYIPLLNPLDLSQLFVIIALAFWALTVRRQLALAPAGLTGPCLFGLAAVALFSWLNAALIRTLHYWGGVPFNFYSMLHSDLAQASLSIFWTLSAFLVMYLAQRQGRRVIWLTGSGLIAIVIAKLFTVDLASTGTVERIVSFIGVGVICLVIGYLAPLPQRIQTETEKP
ncbi:DUF2339 domain-containing protein [Thiovibrio sp. JS02]